MLLTVVGCSGSISGPRSPASCYLIQAPAEGGDFSLVLDLGPGSLGALHNHLEPSAIRAVGLSHLHADHCLDLCGLYVAAAHSSASPFPPIPVYGPPGTAVRIAKAYQAPPPSAVGVAAEEPRLEDRFEFRTWRAEQVIGPFTVRTIEVAHPTPTYAIRVIENSTGAVLVYSGDTGPTPNLAELAETADLLLIEASFLDRPDNPPDLHLSGREAARIATDARVAGVLLTHIPPWHDPQEALAEARPHYAGPLALATSGVHWMIEPGGARPLT